MIWYGMIQESGTPCRIVFSLEFWFVMLVVLSLGGHMNTYRMVSAGRGAFELCLPSLGFLFTKLTLRSLLLGQASHMAPSWVTVWTLATACGSATL